jgi:hypothetical protein
MTEFWGLVLFATFIALAAGFTGAIVYCGCITASHYWNKLQTPPLSTAENQV